jgi:hypothetical protein
MADTIQKMDVSLAFPQHVYVSRKRADEMP